MQLAMHVREMATETVIAENMIVGQALDAICSLPMVMSITLMAT